jgi:site-specific recombinase XerD
MSLNKFAHHFTLLKNRNTKNNLCPIYLRIIVDGKRVNLSTNKSIPETEWINKGGILTSNKDVNTFLSNIERRLLNLYDKLSNADKEISSTILKDLLLGVEEKKHTLINTLELHNKNMESLIGVKYSKGTFKNYKVTLKYMKEFIPLAFKEVDLPLIKLNYDFLKRYELFLTAEKNCTNNGVMKQIRRLKKITHLAIANEWLYKDPFVKFKITYLKNDRGYLTLKELDKIIQADLNPRLALVRDYFVFSCYTGLAYADIKAFTPTNLETDDDGNKWIVINREKTKVQALIPLLPEAKSLLEKYKLIEHKKHGIFPVKSNQKTNDYLKEIAATCSIKKRLSYHIARHSFATTITLSNGVPIETVSKMLGHNRITITQIYSRVLKGKILDDMRGLKKG